MYNGCRHDCPASPALFNLFIEPLVQAIRQETTLAYPLEGIYIGKIQIQLTIGFSFTTHTQAWLLTDLLKRLAM